MSKFLQQPRRNTYICEFRRHRPTSILLQALQTAVRADAQAPRFTPQRNSPPPLPVAPYVLPRLAPTLSRTALRHAQAVPHCAPYVSLRTRHSSDSMSWPSLAQPHRVEDMVPHAFGNDHRGGSHLGSLLLCVHLSPIPPLSHKIKIIITL